MNSQKKKKKKKRHKKKFFIIKKRKQRTKDKGQSLYTNWSGGSSSKLQGGILDTDKYPGHVH